MQEASNADVFSRRRSRAAIISLALAFALMLLLTLIGEAFTPGAADRRPGHNSWSYGARGFRALYEVLEALGYQVERHRTSYRALPPGEEGVLLILDPGGPRVLPARDQSTPGGEDAAAVLRDWVEDGGRVIITRSGRGLFGYRGLEITLQSQDAEDEHAEENDTGGDASGPKSGAVPFLSAAARSRLPGELLAGIPDVVPRSLRGTVRTRSPLAEFAAALPDLTPGQSRALGAYLSGDGDSRIDVFERAPAEAATLLAIGDHPLALEYEVGRGRVVCVSTAFPFANGALKWTPAPEVVAELVRFVSQGGRRRLYFDELTHGLERGSGLLRWARETALFYPLMTILIGLVLAGWYGASRFGPPSPERGPSRRAREEFVLSLGDMYRRGGHYGHALALIVEAYETRLAQLLGPGGGDHRPGGGRGPAAPRFSHRLPATEREFLDVAGRLHEEYLTLVDTVRGKKTPADER